MSEPDIQYFPQSGTWVKPAGAVRVDGLARGGGGGGPAGPGRGEDGELRSWSAGADSLPDTMEVTIGAGGRGAQSGPFQGGTGAAGYMLIVTFCLTDAERGAFDMAPGH